MEQKTAFMISATKSEEERVTIKVLGRKPINSPAIPGMKIKGKKAATVVIVDVVTGIAISLVPNFAASIRLFPACLCLYMFSTITMALSTSRPNERIRLNRTTMLRVNPITLRIIILTKNERGIATATKRALLIPITKRRTKKTRTKPVIILFSKSVTIC